jgi:hypothetical protein
MSGLDEADDPDLELAIQLSLAEQRPPAKPRTEHDWQDLAFFSDATISKREDERKLSRDSNSGSAQAAKDAVQSHADARPGDNQRPDSIFGSLAKLLKPHPTPPSQTLSAATDGRIARTALTNATAANSVNASTSSGRLCSKCFQPVLASVFSIDTVNTSSGEMYHTRCFKCGSCGGQIHGPYTVHSSTSTPYHPSCFRCAGCNVAIDGSFTDYGDPPLPYHATCAKELYAPRCSLCANPLDGHFYRHSYFENEKYCLSHEGRTTCFACGRREPLPSSHKEGFVDLLDGRSLCAQCSGSIIVDASEAVALYRSIVDFMGSALGLSIPSEMRNVPILVVDVHSLNENMSKHNSSLGYHDPSTNAPLTPGNVTVGGGNQLPPGATVRGLTLSTCAEVRHFPSGSAALSQLTGAFRTGQAPQMLRVTEKRDVSAVLVLYGLPRDLTASILAHEAMHVWLKLNPGFPFRMPPKLEEGLCQVIAYMYLDSLVVTDAAAASSSTEKGLEDEQSLRRYFSKQIKDDPSPVYGEGFREAYEVVQQLGLEVTLEYIRDNHGLPPI